MGTKKCEICGRELPAEEFSKSYKNRCKECVAILEREKRKNGRTTAINWEQRRYDIASEMLVKRYIDSPSVASSMAHRTATAKEIVSLADALIEELQSNPL